MSEKEPENSGLLLLGLFLIGVSYFGYLYIKDTELYKEHFTPVVYWSGKVEDAYNYLEYRERGLEVAYLKLEKFHKGVSIEYRILSLDRYYYIDDKNERDKKITDVFKAEEAMLLMHLDWEKEFVDSAKEGIATFEKNLAEAKKKQG